MALLILRTGPTLISLGNPCFLSWVNNLSSRVPAFLDSENKTPQSTSINNRQVPPTNNSNNNFLFSPLLSNIGTQEKDYDIELVDNETWRVSSGLAEAWSETLGKDVSKYGSTNNEVDYVIENNGNPDFDEIEDMRMRGNLFYKLDKDSKEFEEYNFDFHRKKSWKKNKNSQIESKSKETPDHILESRTEKFTTAISINVIKETKRDNSRRSFSELDTNNMVLVEDYGEKKQRTLTFNQLTAPYHEPFCLDIYISKASVRACVIHRATSNVVAVAHSISRDMKFDLGSTKNATACVAVGQILAQRALADDIHNVVYTPRKGEKLEGKLQVVLQSVIDSGINVKVKIKQRKFKKSGLRSRV